MVFHKKQGARQAQDKAKRGRSLLPRTVFFKIEREKVKKHSKQKNSIGRVQEGGGGAIILIITTLSI